jgi:hypothetical protein
MTDSMTAVRARWRSAEDRLYPSLIADPVAYQRALTEIQLAVAELSRRGDEPGVLLAAEADPDALLAEVCPGGTGLPAGLIVAVACSARDRQLTAEAGRQRVERVVAEARAAGRPWAVLAGPEDPAELADGDAVALHLSSGTVLTATVDVWSGGPPYALRMALPDGEPVCSSFTDRAEWLEAYRRGRAGLSGPSASPAGTGAP